jgi:two-component system, LytTR family, sensor kinase
MEQRLILIDLLIKLGMASLLASGLIRSVEFKSLLYRDDRSLKQRFYLVVWLCLAQWLGIFLILGLGKWTRFSAQGYFAGDLAFETIILLGILGGRFSGVLGGVLLSLPAVFQHQWMTLPLYALVGFICGQLRMLSANHEEIWSFSPFNYFSVVRWFRRKSPRLRFFDWQLWFLFTIVALRFLYVEFVHVFPKRTYGVESPSLWLDALLYATSVLVIVIQLKIWNSVRLQIKLEEQQRMLLHARIEALKNQINPHFLFNTLNSISSLVRFDPDTARGLILKLATILRRLLHSTDAFVALRDEVEFIDNYLDIEVVRFGRDKLQVVKDLDPQSLDVMVPSMLLQPLVENSIKHGLSSKLEGGSIHLRSRITDTGLTIEVEDDGVGMGAAQLLEKPTGLGGTGIGMANVAERLKVLYGETARMTVDSPSGKGTLVRLRLPVLQEGGVPIRYEERSSTLR